MNNEQIIKASFAKVKEDIEKLEKTILEQNKEIILLKEQIKEILNELNKKNENLNDFDDSIRNKGVKQINKQINKQTIKQLSTPLSTEFIKNLINQQFKLLTKQELKTFLTIYQIEEEKGKVSYKDLSNSLGITTSCIRIYVANLLKRELPIKKMKVKNKEVILTIKEDFRKLDLKQKLIDLYYQNDPAQTKLLDI